MRASRERLFHPAGVRLPFDTADDASLLPPELRAEVAAGTYSADMIDRIAEAVHPGDRVLVVGAGLGIISTLVARRRATRVIAVEPNVALAAYLERVHALNGVPWVETVNGVLSEERRGRIPFFARNDPRASSLLPGEAGWSHVMMVPLVELNLILAEEDINLIICESSPERVCLNRSGLASGITRLPPRRSMTGT